MAQFNPYIALADDDPDDQEMLAAQFLKRHPDAVFKFFKDGREITHYLETCPTTSLPSLLILDYKMPLSTGADVLKVLQGNPRYSRMHKVVWSTSGNNQYVLECRQYGAEQYFTKPNNVHQLDEMVTKLHSILLNDTASDHP